MSIESLPFEHRPRNSIANNLDRINKLVDWANKDSYLWASASGERVTVDDASSLKGLTVDGRSVQDGTPTPDAPVAVQVVEGRNLLDNTANTTTNNGITYNRNADGSVTVNGTATAASNFIFKDFVRNQFDGNTYFLSGCPSGGSPSTYYMRALKPTPWTNYATDTGDGAVLNLNGIAGNTVIRVQIGIANGTTVNNLTFYPQLEAGSTATPYVPYGSISINIGGTVVPIDLQGNVLASLPKGTRDELHVDSAGHVWIDKRVRHTTQAITDGVTGTVGTDVLSNTGQIADGADVWYKLATQQTIDLGYITPPAIPSGSVVTVSASLTPTIHLEWWVDDGITDLVNDLIAYIDYKTEG